MELEKHFEYKTPDKNDIDYLIKITDKSRVLFGDAVGEDFSHDELNTIRRKPDVIVNVLTADEVSKIMAYAYNNNIPVVARGSGTGLVGAAVPLEGGIMLNFSLMNKILELDEENLTLTLQPGVLLMDVAKYTEEHDLFYPPDPGEKSATIGGNINTNAGGMRAVKYGVTKDYVRGLEVVLPNGTVMKLGGKTVKSSSGYNLKDLICGSEGTLAIVTKIVLKLLPLPKKSISLLVPFEDLDSAIGTVPQIIKSKAMPTSIEFMEKDVILAAEEFLGKKFPDSSKDAYLILTFDGNSKEDIEKEYERVAEICLANGAYDVLIADTDERKDSIWSARGAFLEAVKASTTEMDECDVCVPRNKIADFINYTYELQDKYKMRIKNFGHAGDGNLHIYILRDDLSDDQWHERLGKVFNCLYAKSAEFMGIVSGEHGIGYAKREYLKKSLGEDEYELMRNLKLTFDSKNILNPGKVCE